jgi:hypothetical protein
MPRTCTICRHPDRLRIEQAMITGTSLRDVAARFGTAKTIIARHRTHVADSIVRHAEVRELARARTLLDDIRAGEQRAESLYETAQEILQNALQEKDPRTAIQAIRAASAVMGEARNYLTLRGELTGEMGRDKPPAIVGIQIICPASAGAMPQIVFAGDDAIEVEHEIGLSQRR